MPRDQPALHVVPEIGHEPASVAATLDLDALFRRFGPYVARVAFRLLGRDSDVDDTVQEVFLVAVRSVGSVRDPNAVKAWLARITVRVARRRLRKRKLRSFFGVDDPGVYEKLADLGASPEDRALLARVYRVLEGIPANCRIAWALRYIEGEPLESVAALSSCSLATVKRRIAEASRTLDEAFSDG
jgi:RNA polymerase sigma-70 factor (ECF subfamily)